MLTVGLMEGVLSAAIGALILVGLGNENAPLHKLFGPPVVLVAGIAAYGIHAAGVVKGAGDVIGLGFFAFVVFFVPLGIMRAGWKYSRTHDAAPMRPRSHAPSTPTGAVEPPSHEPPAKKVA